MTFCAFPPFALHMLMFKSGRRPSDASAASAARSISSSASSSKYELVQAILEDMSSKASDCASFGDNFGYTRNRTCCRDSKITVIVTMSSVCRALLRHVPSAHTCHRGHVSKGRRRLDCDIAIECRPEDQTKESAEEAWARPGIVILQSFALLLLKLPKGFIGHSVATTTINVSNCKRFHFFLPQVNTDCTLPCTYEPFFPVACASLAAAMMALKS